MNKNNLFPALRFPNFINNNGWEEKALKKIAKKVLLKNKNGLINRVFTNSANDGIVDQREYFDKDIADKNNLDNYYVVEHGDYVYNPRISSIAPVGPISKNKTNQIGVMSPLYTVFRFNDKSDDFYEYYFKSVHWYDSIKKLSNIGARFDRISITDSVFMDIQVLYPHLNEQKKIADCLSSLDEIITFQTLKIKGLKKHKQGVLQNLFPVEGEKIPKLRFKEFENDVEWTVEPFSDIYSFLVTNSFSRENLNYHEGTVKNIHYGDIHTKFSTLFDIKNEVVPYINLDIVLARIRSECYCEEGDLIFADASEDIDDVGKSIEIINLNNEKLLSGLHTLLARQIESKLITGFGGYLFKSNELRKQIKREAQGAKVLGISGTRLSNIKVYYPENKVEQQKIVDCLSSLDTEIQAEVKRLNVLKDHKRGLMQQLFPKIKE